MEGTRYNFLLLFARELVEIDRVSRNSDGEVGVCFWIFVGFDECCAVENVDVEMVSTVCEISVKQRDEVGDAFLVGATECFGNYRKGVGDSVHCGRIRNFGDRIE